jgi:hypothetical protein
MLNASSSRFDPQRTSAHWPVAKCPRYPLTDPRQFDILQFGPG